MLDGTQGDMDSNGETSKALSQRKSLRPSLTRSPTVNKGAAAPEKPGAAMVSFLIGKALVVQRAVLCCAVLCCAVLCYAMASAACFGYHNLQPD